MGLEVAQASGAVCVCLGGRGSDPQVGQQLAERRRGSKRNKEILLRAPRGKEEPLSWNRGERSGHWLSHFWFYYSTSGQEVDAHGHRAGLTASSAFVDVLPRLYTSRCHVGT